MFKIVLNIRRNKMEMLIRLMPLISLVFFVTCGIICGMLFLRLGKTIGQQKMNEIFTAGIMPENIDENSANQEFRAEIAIEYRYGKLQEIKLIKGTTKRVI
jgi:predicted metal-binding protein